MATNYSTQSFQDLLSFPFRSPGGKTKLLIAGLLSLAGFLIPIIPGLFVAGYGGLIMRRIIREKGDPYLPEWDNLGEMCTLGLKISAASFVYSLPLLVLWLLAYAGIMIPAFLMPFMQPASMEHNFGPWFALYFAGTFAGMAVMGVALILAIGLFLILPPMIGHVVATDSFAAAFRVSEWWKILRANLGGFVVALVLAAGVYAGMVMVAQGLYMTMVLCILIPVLMSLAGAYIMVIGSVMFAQAYTDGVTKLANEPVKAALPPQPSAI